MCDQLYKLLEGTLKRTTVRNPSCCAGDPVHEHTDTEKAAHRVHNSAHALIFVYIYFNDIHKSV